MPFLKDVVGPCFIIEDVIARGGATHETIFYIPPDPHFREDVKQYCQKTNAMIPCWVDCVRAVAVGKKLPYGRLILDKPYRTKLIVFHKGDDGSGMESTYSTITFDVDTSPQRTTDEHYLERAANSLKFREDFERLLRQVECLSFSW